MAENRLNYETSPYLRQHADNPVHWRPWGPDAFAEAKQAGKPVLLSVGYAACHWCHVMAHESFEDAEVAAVMNDLYVNIKVDREERPDVDQLYMDALHLLGEHGGWPLTMFLTPEGDAVWGGTYFPKEPKYGRPGFVQVLKEFHRLFREEPHRIAHNRDAIRARLAAPAEDGGGQLEDGLVAMTAARLLPAFDPVNGGLKGAPKFPQTTLLKLMWQGGLASGQDELLDAVTFALHRMSRGGIYDHLGGGFSRYAVDERWLVPHFEKMLYDNALLLDLLVLAWLRTGDPLFRTRIVDTVGWLQREMTVAGGAFAASLDADSEGKEGLFYTWTRDEIDAALGTDADAFAAVYDVTPGGNFEGRSILNRLADPFPLADADEARLAECRAKLLAAREPRVRPGRDDKVLADWNGLMITALARAASVFDEPSWRGMAERAYQFITESMTREGRLAHSLLGEKLVFPGLSSDHAAMIQAALALHESTGAARYLADAEAFAGALDAWHWDDGSGGYFLAAADAADIAIRLKRGHDDAIPNANGTMVANLSRLWRLTGQARYRDRADAILDAYSGAILRNPAGHASLVSGLDQRLDAVDIVVVGTTGDAGRQALESAAQAVPDPNASVLAIGPEAMLPEDHPAAGKGLVDGRSVAYVCRGETCSLPLTDPGDLREAARRAPVAAA